MNVPRDDTVYVEDLAIYNKTKEVVLQCLLRLSHDQSDAQVDGGLHTPT